MDDRPRSTLDHWRDLRARTWDALIWWLMTRVLTPLLHLGIRAAELPPLVNARASSLPVYNGERMHIEFNGVKLTLDDVEDMRSKDWWEELRRQPPQTVMFSAMGIDEPNGAQYRDEDGDLHPVRPDRTPLVDATMEDLAAEFLHAKSDAENTPDPLEREIVAAMRDAYGRELYRRREQGHGPLVAVRGTIYRIIPLAPGAVDLVSIG